jgi:DNA primase
VVGFGGRILKEGEPKYLNSPESAIYHKGEILYGLHVAKRYVPTSDQVIIVEGYFDLLTLHQYGFKQSVATLGTALTTHHIRNLKRYTKNFITLFDGDSAGVQAILRSLPLLLEQEVWGETVILPGRTGWLSQKEIGKRLKMVRDPLVRLLPQQRMRIVT